MLPLPSRPPVPLAHVLCSSHPIPSILDNNSECDPLPSFAFARDRPEGLEIFLEAIHPRRRGRPPRKERLPFRCDERVQAPGLPNGTVRAPEALPSVFRDDDAWRIKVPDCVYNYRVVFCAFFPLPHPPWSRPRSLPRSHISLLRSLPPPLTFPLPLRSPPHHRLRPRFHPRPCSHLRSCPRLRSRPDPVHSFPSLGLGYPLGTMREYIHRAL